MSFDTLNFKTHKREDEDIEREELEK